MSALRRYVRMIREVARLRASPGAGGKRWAWIWGWGCGLGWGSGR